MPNSTNTNPLPLKHTHVVADIADLDAIQGGKIKKIVVLRDEDENDYWVEFTEADSGGEGSPILDTYKANNYQKIKNNTTSLKSFLKKDDIVNIVYCFVLNDEFNSSEIDVNGVEIDISPFKSDLTPTINTLYNLYGVYGERDSQYSHITLFFNSHSHHKHEIVNGNTIVTWDNKVNPKIKNLTKQQYDQLQSKDSETLYIIPET